MPDDTKTSSTLPIDTDGSSVNTLPDDTKGYCVNSLPDDTGGSYVNTLPDDTKFSSVIPLPVTSISFEVNDRAFFLVFVFLLLCLTFSVLYIPMLID